MKQPCLMVYCQHVLGIGHLCRMLLILEQLRTHRITLVLGGSPLRLDLPKHVRVIQLPGLRMDETLSCLLPVEPGQEISSLQEQRKAQLSALFQQLQPDLLLVELFPFGRNLFRFELLPLLEQAQMRQNCRVVCSVRDILVERDNTEKFEQRVIDRLNQYFDLLLVHGDPRLLTLDETFSRMEEIKIPVSYTGYICQAPQPGEGKQMRKKNNINEKEKLILVSAGSGSVGQALLTAAVDAFQQLNNAAWRMQVFTGPYLAESDFQRLKGFSSKTLKVERFSNTFPGWLAAADLSISMAGYNTTMNLLAADCPGLVFPFAQNREQRMRAEQLEQRGCLHILRENDLQADILANKIVQSLSRKTAQSASAAVLLDGAVTTAKLLHNFSEAKL